MTEFNPRHLMELAIKIMRQSIPEPRSDGKVNPKVGAVLYMQDGSIETAYRGEFRYGDHAEFTLLERKNKDKKLDGSILFVTLEPCAKGSRSDLKMSCSERIYLARIKEVWVGIQDPDPTVARKGIGYLSRHGVSVRMFDRDLQEVIEKDNKLFLENATERADKIEEEPVEVALSPLEDKLPSTELEDLSEEAIEIYRSKAKIADAVGSGEFNQRLLRQGLIKKEDDTLVPTGFGFLLFGKEPRTVMKQAGLLGLIHYPGGQTERREFDEPMVKIPDNVEQWLKNKLPNVFSRDHSYRQETSPIPYEMVREAVANALIHRDYGIVGAKCQIVVTEDAITVKSPGGPPSPITINQLQDFSAPMLSRNPELHFVFARMGMAEEQGLGLSSLRERAKELSLPIPRYKWDEPYLVLSLYLSAEGATEAIDKDKLKTLSKSEQKGWKWLTTQGKVKSSEYARAMGVENRTARRHLTHFEELGLVRRVGAGPSLQYKVNY